MQSKDVWTGQDKQVPAGKPKPKRKKITIDTSSTAEQLLLNLTTKAEVSLEQTKQIASPPVINFDNADMSTKKVVTKENLSKKQPKNIHATEKCKAKRRLATSKQKPKLSLAQTGALNVQQPIQTNG